MVSGNVVLRGSDRRLRISVANTRSKLRASANEKLPCRSTAPVNRLLSLWLRPAPIQHLNIHRRVRLGKAVFYLTVIISFPATGRRSSM